MAAEQEGLQPQVFISHTAKDTQGRVFAVSILKPALEAANVKVFIDETSLALGCTWPAELVKEAATSAVFVAVLTESYPTRPWCLRELDLALHGHADYPRGSAKPPIIPVYIDHHLQTLTVEELQEQVQQRMDRLAAAGANRAAWQGLQRPDFERMLQNIPALKTTQAVHRQRQELLPQEQLDQQLSNLQLQQAQQQQPAAAGGSSSVGSRVQPPKGVELQLAHRVVAAALQVLPAKQRLAYIPPDLVGYKEQLADLTAQLTVDGPGMLGLWLYGPGGFVQPFMSLIEASYTPGAWGLRLHVVEEPQILPCALDLLQVGWERPQWHACCTTPSRRATSSPRQQGWSLTLRAATVKTYANTCYSC